MKTLLEAATDLRIAQRIYMLYRENYQEGHPKREEAGRAVAKAAMELDDAIIAERKKSGNQ